MSTSPQDTLRNNRFYLLIPCVVLSASVAEKYARKSKMKTLKRELEGLRKKVEFLDEMPSYTMTADPRGICVIINNVTFHGKKKMKDRPGSDTDQGTFLLK
jgi:hypothetical protein